MWHCSLVSKNEYLVLFNASKELTMPFYVQFLKEERLCLHRSHRSFVAHYSKKEHLIISIFSFGITLTLSPKVDSSWQEGNTRMFAHWGWFLPFCLLFEAVVEIREGTERAGNSNFKRLKCNSNRSTFLTLTLVYNYLCK